MQSVDEYSATSARLQTTARTTVTSEHQSLRPGESVDAWRKRQFPQQKGIPFMAKQPTTSQNSDMHARDEAHTEQKALSRRSLMRGALITGAAVAPMGVMVAVTHAQQAASPMLNARNSGGVEFPHRGSVASAFVEIQSDENAHVKFLQNALGSGARPKPTFKGLQSQTLNSFYTLSKVFENTGVGAYLMAAPAISSKDYLAAAGSILTIEARHAGFLDFLQAGPLGPNGAFDKPIMQADIVSAVSPFIASLNGGSDPAGKLGSDADILNFALLLEFLEAEFYNINVPKFFGTPGQG